MRKQTLEEFVSKFREKFPEKYYSFDKSIYVNSHKPMTVVCSCGYEFKSRPCDLLNGYGCPKCGGTKKMSNDEFIEKANYVHCNYFTYDRCNFVGSNKKVMVTCPIHGDFEVKANNHLSGANCKLCKLEGIKHQTRRLPQVNSSTKKLTTDMFKVRIKEKWGDRYELATNCEYVNSRTPVIIVCKEHGEFNITPNHLLSGRGCPFCGKNKKKNTQEIIDEIKNAQPYSDYDYSYVEYRGIHKNITLKCNKCGTVFSNSPSNLIKYQNGCPGCGGSHLEIDMEHFLKQNRVAYEREKRFEWLSFKGFQRIDFFLPEYNAAIECQGIQHFMDVNFGDSVSLVSEVKERDDNKRILCEQNGISVYYFSDFHIKFPYFVYEDKETMLNDIKSEYRMRNK